MPEEDKYKGSEICPIMLVDNDDDNSGYCMKEKCAWWYKHGNCCAVYMLSYLDCLEKDK